MPRHHMANQILRTCNPRCPGTRTNTPIYSQQSNKTKTNGRNLILIDNQIAESYMVGSATPPRGRPRGARIGARDEDRGEDRGKPSPYYRRFGYSHILTSS